MRVKRVFFFFTRKDLFLDVWHESFTTIVPNVYTNSDEVIYFQPTRFQGWVNREREMESVLGSV